MCYGSIILFFSLTPTLVQANEIGPFIGHMTPDSVTIWYRADTAGTYQLRITSVHDDSFSVPVDSATAGPETDLTVQWTVTGLKPENEYRYTIAQNDQAVIEGDDFVFRTPPPTETRQQIRIAFGSCAREDEGSAGVWTRMGSENVDALVLLGDTPYIDSTDLETQRRRYREFTSVSPFQALLHNRSFYSTWDDHDFGRNDTDGRLAGKEASRRAFLEYHALPSYGEDGIGIYTKFRRGPIEVFLLDARTFAATEPSPVEPNKPTLLGSRQWDWLLRELKLSTAPFKVIASGMIWNEATRPNKPDHWMSYPHEREALWRYIGNEGITGVVLVGGDIHRTRVLRHSTKDRAGYDLLELITSPIHDSVIEAANAPHPDLVFDAGEPHSFLLLSADTTTELATLQATFMNAAGERFYELKLTENDLR